MRFNVETGLIEYTKAEAKAGALFINGACGSIGSGSNYPCAPNGLSASVENRLILIDKDVYDRATVTFDMTLTSLITNIVLTQSGDAGYAFIGVRRSTRPQSAFVPQTVSIGYDHQVEFQIFDISQAQKDNIEKLALSRVVAIVQNANAPGNADSVFEVFGKDVGLEMQAGPMRINTDLETNGSYTINLKTSDDSGKEGKLPTSFSDGAFGTTKAKVDALLTPVP